MLNHENIKPKKCAIDRPTDAMLSFLSKNFALKNPLKQHNHFVIFDGFFA
ncbi:alpha-tubulin N-acetyltransferase-like isoform X2 [Dinothrombium tinctorium]|uniref:Alpha-tubulin N-acetyltransferase-like isoform X2 n=1 Tax=Dinothrombium tinctorium TaxID=1965070 RepID=A0A3S3Q5U9_9ACAR|nr:alpha-tubulin N-acetyltransferase-like isoform X2 [Dinothrombium tinctorium]